MSVPITPNPLPVRTPLGLLRLDFPHHDITQQAISGKLFYLAEARPGSRAQPDFAQALTVDRLRGRLARPLRPFTPSQASIPRVWDVLLGGKDNFTADRTQADALLDVCPWLGHLARQSRQFQARAAAYAARQGIRQFIDLGCGLPTDPATHDTVQAIQPTAHVVYVDNDEQVIIHARGLLEKTPGVIAIEGDLAAPDEITHDWRVRRVLDFTQPIGLITAMTLHFFAPDTAATITRQLVHAVPPGSHLIISTGQLEGQAAADFTRRYEPNPTYHHRPGDLAAFLAGLDLVPPGITDARTWQPGTSAGPATATAPAGPGTGHVWAAVARKPASPP